MRTLPIPIIYRDDDLLIIAKPSGLVVHRGWAEPKHTLIELLREQLNLDRLHVVHRLDRSTSGVMAFALNPEAAKQISAAFRARQIRKIYFALVRGTFRFSGLLDHPIPKAPGEPRVDAQTVFQHLASAPTIPRETSIVWAQPKTGRTHQIRRHLKHLNHPIIGDVNYGRGELNRAARMRYNLNRLGLHAWQLELKHPRTGQTHRWSSDIPPTLNEPLVAMGYAVDELEAQASRFDTA